ncbi:cytochrome b/b6 domain-containing protein [Pararhodospirillum photometricum]|nr:cytochrome b/b6 domain-containing protein [Pararhodospirillum photometricum]
MTEETSPTPATLRIWDLPTRVFHWSLVVLLLLLYISGDLMEQVSVHMFLGKVTVALVIARIIWGVVGSETSRFSSFLKGPKDVKAYIDTVKSGGHWQGIGHNPAGAYMMLGLLALILFLGFTGLFTEDNTYATKGGPFFEASPEWWQGLMTFLHHNVFYLLLLGALGHIGAALFYKFVKKDDLIHPLVTGVRPAIPGVAEPAFAPPLLAAGIFLASLVVVFIAV